MIEFTEQERWLLVHIIKTGGYDYDVWPAIQDSDMPILNELEERGIIAVMGDGDIRVTDSGVRNQIEQWIRDNKG